MTTPPRDPAAVQTMAAEISTGALRFCTECRCWYHNTPSDRMYHVQVRGHAVSGEREAR